MEWIDCRNRERVTGCGGSIWKHGAWISKGSNSFFSQYHNQHSFTLFYILHLTESPWMLVIFMSIVPVIFLHSLLVLWHAMAQGRLWLITWISATYAQYKFLVACFFSNILISSETYTISIAIFMPFAVGINSGFPHIICGHFFLLHSSYTLLSSKCCHLSCCCPWMISS
jgi:hypothetical protein